MFYIRDTIIQIYWYNTHFYNNFTISKSVKIYSCPSDSDISIHSHSYKSKVFYLLSHVRFELLTFLTMKKTQLMLFNNLTTINKYIYKENNLVKVFFIGFELAVSYCEHSRICTHVHSVFLLLGCTSILGHVQCVFVISMCIHLMT